MKTSGGSASPGMASHWGDASSLEACLGKLVNFDKRGRTSRVKPTHSGNAQIYIFTGVRYERDGTPVPSKPTGTSRAKRKRV
jgi:hypothetical protein